VQQWIFSVDEWRVKMPVSTNNAKLGDLVREWYDISQGIVPQQPTVFFQFIAGWIAFNAIYAADGSPDNPDRELLRRYARRPDVKDLHRRLFDSDREYQEAVRALARKRILDTRYDDSEDAAQSSPGEEISDGRSAKQVLFAIYQVRSNLLHGGKHPHNPRDAEVVRASHAIMSRLLASEIDAVARWTD
jgi:hypothetical protein